ncbi:Cytochrome P450 9e2 [Harpegnathos saltator]|uniref:Cytochrome P450 9e2 n=1 Tax=Harpegnathos saltator TaxID=610380 RepID=E2B5J5_HARSA|nr:Cytochrome P450 9e2 [Harpegnathos saltator]
MVYTIIFSAIIGALAFYYFFFKNLSEFKNHGIPYVRPLPIVGNFGQTIIGKKSLGEVLKMLYDEYPKAKYIGMYDLHTPVIMLRDPELIKSIAIKHFNMFPNHRVLLRLDQDPFTSQTLFILRDEKAWRKRRTILSPAFTSSKMKS